jgi:uncharacterized protein YlxW (UPF0749 family)
VAAVVGFVVVGQLRATSRVSPGLEAQSEGDLTRILASLNGEADGLREEISNLKLELATLEGSSQRDEVALQTARAQLQSLRVLAGTVPVAGPGITLTIDDPRGAVTYDVVIDAVQELRDAGAEAIAIDGVRVGTTSAFSERDGRVALDDSVLAAPYRVDAIGPAATMEGGLRIPGGVVDSLGALKGAHGEIQRAARLELPALITAPVRHAARPVGSSP